MDDNIPNNTGNNDNGNHGNNNKNNKNEPPKNKQTILVLLIASLVTLLFLSYIRTMLSNASAQEISYDEFISMVEAGEVESVDVGADQITITPKQQDNPLMPMTYYTGVIDDPGRSERL